MTNDVGAPSAPAGQPTTPAAPLSRLVAFGAIALLVIALDHLTKWMVVRKLPFNHDVHIAGEWVMLTHIKNTGGAFGLFPGSTLPLILVSSAASVVLCYLAVRLRHDWTRLIALGLILGGAIGNLIDRIFQKKVTDFIHVGIPDGPRWPIFNVADSAVSIGVGILAWYVYVKGSKADELPAPADAPAPTAEPRVDHAPDGTAG
ncbi:MAG TPA: signal peptidase II [Candidatus Eisenbacteria bacterium]